MLDLRPDVVIAGKLRLLRPLGHGGMGVVWAARHLALETDVAVKLIRPERAAERPEMEARFEREARTTARIAHPHVVRVMDYGAAFGGVPYIVMELLRGFSLAELLERGGRLSLATARSLVQQIGSALESAHEHGVVHRDIKPHNVFITEGSRDFPLFVKVLDFGVAKMLDVAAAPAAGPALTETGVVIGSAPYMSPEQLEGSKDVDLRSDLWSLAVIAYEALTGTLPFQGSSFVKVGAAVLSGRYRPATELRPDLPAAIDDWFAKALCVDPGGRFQSAREMVEAFAIAGAGEPGEERPSGVTGGSANGEAGGSANGGAGGSANGGAGGEVGGRTDPYADTAESTAASSASVSAQDMAPAVTADHAGPAEKALSSEESATGEGATPPERAASPPLDGLSREGAHPRSRSARPPLPGAVLAASRLRASREGSPPFSEMAGVPPPERTAAPLPERAVAPPLEPSAALPPDRAAPPLAERTGVPPPERAHASDLGAAPRPEPRSGEDAAGGGTSIEKAGSRSGRRGRLVGAVVAGGAAALGIAGIVRLSPWKGPVGPASCPAGMALVEGTTFAMGSPEGGETPSDETPLHEVAVAAFCLDVREVTNKAYSECGACGRAPMAVEIEGLTANARGFWSQFCNPADGADHPVNCVDWQQARAYCAEQGKRLPTEAEWELSARGQEGRTYPWGSAPPGPERLNACGAECSRMLTERFEKVGKGPWPGMHAGDDAAPSTAPVGRYAAGSTPAGIFDLAGNVWEWTESRYCPYGKDECDDSRRVLRGGGWDTVDSLFVRAAHRRPSAPSARGWSIGFRCAKSL